MKEGFLVKWISSGWRLEKRLYARTQGDYGFFRCVKIRTQKAWEHVSMNRQKVWPHD